MKEMKRKGKRAKFVILRLDEDLYEVLRNVSVEEIISEEPILLPKEKRGKKIKTFIKLKEEDLKEIDQLARLYSVSRSRFLRGKLLSLKLKNGYHQKLSNKE